MACTYMFHAQTVIQTWLFWPATAILGYSVFLLKYVSATDYVLELAGVRKEDSVESNPQTTNIKW